jgi:uncharacterized RDD family membrane protein YckC
MYQVIDPSGETFGPAPVDVLRQWAVERRLTPEMTLVDEATGQRGLAGDMLLGKGIFLDPLPPDPTRPQVTAVVHTAGYAYRGSSEPGRAPFLQTRAVAFFIDSMFAMTLYFTLHYGLWALLLSRIDYTNWGIFSYVDYLFIPVVLLFFLLRDCLFPGQSIGKRIAGLKVVTTSGKPLTPKQSVLRNIVAVPMFFLPMPYIAFVALGLLIVGFCAECFAVMTLGRRYGDGLALTAVVNS